MWSRIAADAVRRGAEEDRSHRFHSQQQRGGRRFLIFIIEITNASGITARLGRVDGAESTANCDVGHIPAFDQPRWRGT